MEYHNAIEPSEAQIAMLMEPDDEPIYMVNLLKYRDKAEYADGRETDLSGREAYEIYGAGVVETLADVGAEVVFGGRVSGLVLGEVEELWDDVAIAKYPNRAAMLAMIASPKYQDILVHRNAGLAGQLNIETRVG
jgi:uncharacterized protein (DUF1330 family)